MNGFVFNNSLTIDCYQILQNNLSILDSLNSYTVDYSDIASRGIKLRKEGKDNSYAELKPAKGKNGIYFLYNISTYGTVRYFYIGINTLNEDSTQDLYTRLTQHFTAHNSGGLPAKLAKQHFLKQNIEPTDSKKASVENYMLNYLINNELQLTFYVLDEDIDKIKSLEKFLIKLLQPKLNTQLK